MNETPSLSKQLRVFKKIIGTSLRHYPLLFISIFLINMVLALIPVTQIWIGKLVIDKLVLYLKDTSQNVYITEIFKLALLEFILHITQNIFGYIRQYINTIFVMRFKQRTREDFLRKCDTIPYAYFEDTQFYNELDIIRSTVYQELSSYLATLFSFSGSLIRIVALCGIFLHLSPILIGLLLLINIVSFFLNTFIVKQRYKLKRELTEPYRKVGYIGSLLTNHRFLHEIKLFQVGQSLIKKLSVLYQDIIAKHIRMQKKQMSISAAEQLAGNILYYGFYIVAIKRVIQGTLTIGDISLYQRGFRNFNSTLQTIISSVIVLQEANIYLDKYFSFLEETYAQTEDADKSPLDAINTIALSNASFAYPHCAQQVIKDASVAFTKGEIVCLVGVNGSGKSTLTKLISGLFDPEVGDISINGKPRSDYARKSYYQQTGVIFQQFNKYEMSFRDNIVYGDIQHENDEEKLNNVISRLNLSSLISRLNKGVSTYMSKRFENGHTISGGEWKRLKLATLLFRDPSLIILDEPAANTDVYYREMLEAVLQDLNKNKDRIIIIVTHDLRLTEFADRVVVLKDGTIVEDGKPHALMEARGEYCRLWGLKADTE